MKKKIKLIYIFFLIQSLFLATSTAKINIIAYVDEEIITNYDILKESRYLKILNPNLNNLNEDQILKIAKQSLIKEIIKKKEITKLIDFNKENKFIDEYLSNLLSRLQFQDEKTFSNALLENKTYSIQEIRSKIKIELFWNELIFSKYNNQLNINEEELFKKVKNLENKKKREFLLYEIVFKKKDDENLEVLISEIKKSINEIGFNNTANLFSISESSKFGGKVGWVKEDALSKKIYEGINNLNINEYSEVLKLDNNFIILKIDEIRNIENNIDKKKELQKLIQIERNKKLEKFSRIFYSKAKTNYLINEK